MKEKLVDFGIFFEGVSTSLYTKGAGCREVYIQERENTLLFIPSSISAATRLLVCLTAVRHTRCMKQLFNLRVHALNSASPL